MSDVSPTEEERIFLLMEECAEVIQICRKILRHGYEFFNPDDPEALLQRAQDIIYGIDTDDDLVA